MLTATPKALSLGDMLKFCTAEDLEAAQTWLSEQFQLFETVDYTDEESGRVIKSRERTDKWTPEIALVYQLLIAAQVYKDTHEMKQRSLFDILSE